MPKSSKTNQKLQSLFHDYVKPTIPKRIRDTALLRLFGLVKIPLLFSVGPTVVEISDERSVVRIKLNKWTKNHWGSMYFGTLAIGADCAVGLMAMHHIWNLEAQDVQLIFKDFQASFLKRPNGHVLFICEEGSMVRDLVLAAQKTGERQNLTVKGRAELEENPGEPVVEFALTLSLKRKSPEASRPTGEDQSSGLNG
jgi:acyl-coenzyme A thioesterase PaaI-like protein